MARCVRAEGSFAAELDRRPASAIAGIRRPFVANVLAGWYECVAMPTIGERGPSDRTGECLAESGPPPRSCGFTAERYAESGFFELERARVFAKTWLIVGREGDVPRPGDRLPVDELGESLLLARDTDGHVRVFRNFCLHRGTRLVAKKCMGPTIVCPYHGWTYGLDGRLLRVPKPEGFATVAAEWSRLDEVRSACWGGFIWVTLNPAAPPLSDYLGTLEEQLQAYDLQSMHPLLQRTWTLPCNWKAVIDQATETYHVDIVHSRSVAPFVDTKAETVATFYGLAPHHLQTLPILNAWWRPWLDRWSTPRNLELTADQLGLMHKYVVFPNTILNVLPYHLTVFRVLPITATSCRLHYGFYVRRRPGAVALLRGWATVLASLYILREDLKMLGPFQAGVNAAGRHPLSFHREERPLEYFHGVVDDYLRGAKD